VGRAFASSSQVRDATAYTSILGAWRQAARVLGENPTEERVAPTGCGQLGAVAGAAAPSRVTIPGMDRTWTVGVLPDGVENVQILAEGAGATVADAVGAAIEALVGADRPWVARSSASRSRAGT
jgi:hypothetical protein